MTRTFFFSVCCLVCLSAHAQLNQRFDNTNYKALYSKEAAALIKNNPHLLLLDVRSPGEYADTSSTLEYNMGRLKGSVNIDIDSIEKHLKDLEAYKDKTILVYCSHSQRSRRVSRFLGDHGFKKVNSLNGGMSLLNKSTDADFPLKSALYITHNPYKLIQSTDAYKFILDKKNVIIDLRPASQFNNTDTAEENNIGRIKGAINIPAGELDSKMTSLARYKNKPILLYDLNNSESPKAALKLSKAGYKNIYVLFEGMNTLLVNTPSTSALRKALFVNTPHYQIAGAMETIALVRSTPNLLVADLRPKSQYENKSDRTYMNIGHINHAVNLLTIQQLKSQLSGKPKTTPILIYGSGMSGMAGMEASLNASTVCRELSGEGYTRVYLVYNGLYSVVWAVTNVENCRNGFDILTDHKGLY